MGEMDMIGVDPSNAEQARAWDGDEGEYWAMNAERFDAGVARYHEAFLNRAAIGPAEQVLDIGCGTGQTTRDAARLAADGAALGIDLSSRMVEVARRTARREGVANVTFERGDAQVHHFPAGRFDISVSRMGTMFFCYPVAAFTNIARAVRPGGRLALLVWQGADGNEWLREILGALSAGRDLPPPPTDGPSPISMADPDRVRRILAGAGFTGVTLEGRAEPMDFGATAEEAHRFVAGLMAWMVDGLEAEHRSRALDALRATMEAHATADGVLFESATWLVTAIRP